jgi:hypothetical protein
MIWRERVKVGIHTCRNFSVDHFKDPEYYQEKLVLKSVEAFRGFQQ